MGLVLGEVYQEKGEAPAWEDLYNRRESYPIGEVNEKACILTMGVDCQQDYLAYEVIAWGPNLESWSVDWGNIPGDTASDEVWQELSTVGTAESERADHRSLQVRHVHQSGLHPWSCVDKAGARGVSSY